MPKLGRRSLSWEGEEPSQGAGAAAAEVSTSQVTLRIGGGGGGAARDVPPSTLCSSGVRGISSKSTFSSPRAFSSKSTFSSRLV